MDNDVHFNALRFVLRWQLASWQGHSFLLMLSRYSP
jgi:hypothetical protein